MEHYLNYVSTAIQRYWNTEALSNYQGKTFSYCEIASEIEKYHLTFKECGIEKGDKIILCGKNSADWAVAFLAITTYNAVVVPLLNDFLPENVVDLTLHSDSVAMFVDDVVWKGIEDNHLQEKLEEGKKVKVVVNVNDGTLFYAQKKEYAETFEQRETLFNKQHPKGLQSKEVKYDTTNWDAPVIISYTSGTTSQPKGVVLSARSISSNVIYSIARMPNQPGWTVLSMLPMAHLYGLICDFIYPFVTGAHIYFLGKTPTPAILLKALADVKPYMVLMVPLIVEKIFKSKIFPLLEKPALRIMLCIPGIRQLIFKKIKNQLLKVFGGNLYDGIVMGGAALNKRVEKLLKAMKFPYTVGYGMTECGPLICFEDFSKFKIRSCGKPVWNIQLKVESEDPQHEVGEICVKGFNVMLGYYKNEEATKNVLSYDGWLRTGDMGLIDKHGNVFIKGRCKNMLLGPNGQNIYPEEIEDKVNTSPFVSESLVVSRNNALTAIIVPDMEALKGCSEAEIKAAFNDLLKLVNSRVPQFCRLAHYELREEPFEKTPKKSIRRFLYK